MQFRASSYRLLALMPEMRTVSIYGFTAIVSGCKVASWIFVRISSIPAHATISPEALQSVL